MEENILENIKTIENMDTEYLNGLMVEDMQACGKMVNSTEKVNIEKQIKSRKKVSGIMDKERNGLKIKVQIINKKLKMIKMQTN